MASRIPIIAISFDFMGYTTIFRYRNRKR